MKTEVDIPKKLLAEIKQLVTAEYSLQELLLDGIREHVGWLQATGFKDTRKQLR